MGESHSGEKGSVVVESRTRVIVLGEVHEPLPGRGMLTDHLPQRPQSAVGSPKMIFARSNDDPTASLSRAHLYLALVFDMAVLVVAEHHLYYIPDPDGAGRRRRHPFLRFRHASPGFTRLEV